MKITEEFLKKILVDAKLIFQEDFDLASKEAKTKNEPLENLLIEKGFISDEELGSLVTDAIGFPFVNLRKIKLDREILEIVPEVVARKNLIIVFERTKEGLKMAMNQPEDIEIRGFIERKTGEKVIPYFATKRDIEEAFKYYKREMKEELEQLVGKTLKELEKKIVRPESLGLPIIKIVDLILNSGYENRASDIHLEPYLDKTILRYRIDGILHDVLILPKFFHDFLVSRIKILSKLRTDIHDTAQDGHFSFSTPQEKFDVRVSIVPIEEGEKAVLRLLSEKAQRLVLQELGLEEKDLQIINQNLKKTWGMILVSGPAGSGKTTTLYACLKVLNIREISIMTIEDPIEYDIEGISQIQVNPETKLTFTEGLKAIIRQNPDIIMVGEIRDRETASLAVNAAMTGHLVLSTFHASDTATALPRLAEMGIEPFLVTSTVNLIISQRLVRKICPKCIESYEISFSEVSSILGKKLATELPKTEKNKICLFRGRGCPLCQGTGYLGRIGIFEILEMEEPIRKLVMIKANAAEIKEKARELGMTLMIEDGLKKVEKGITTLEEILRVLRE